MYIIFSPKSAFYFRLGSQRWIINTFNGQHGLLVNPLNGLINARKMSTFMRTHVVLDSQHLFSSDCNE